MSSSPSYQPGKSVHLPPPLNLNVSLLSFFIYTFFGSYLIQSGTFRYCACALVLFRRKTGSDVRKVLHRGE